MTMWTRNLRRLEDPIAILSQADFTATSESRAQPTKPSIPLVKTLDIEQQIGITPLLSFRRITAHLPECVRIYAKAEWMNPGGSVKDRTALNIVKQLQA